jgi:two-component system OmpR family sensor kinase
MSIRLRLTIYWAAMLAAILVIASLAAYQLFAREQWGTFNAALAEEADTIAHGLARVDAARARTMLQNISGEADIGPRRRVRLVTRSGVFADFGDLDAPLPKVTLAQGFHGLINSPGGEYRFAVIPLLFQGEPAMLENGADSALVRDAILSLRNALMLTVPVVLILCVGGGYWLAGRALRPVAALTAALAAIEPRDLARRLDAPAVRDEIGRLSDVINQLLDRLERASIAERRFASDAAHELRTPLAVLRSGLDVALARPRDADQARAALESAHREVVALCKIAEELLMLARLSGEVHIERQPLDFAALAADVAATIEPLASSRNVKLNAQPPAGAVIVDGSATHLRRLVINLLDNALRYTPDGGAIEVGVASERGQVILRVADSGPGIAPADLPHIFDRFFRGARAVGDGSGLGLSLCREIARIHGGEIAAANRPAGGSEFTVSIPAGREGALAAAAG